jgi:phosphonate transport system substrate-binding protein
MNFGLKVSLVVALIGVMIGCAEAPVGSKARPFTLYFVPTRDTARIVTGSDMLAKYLQKSLSQKLYGNDDGFKVKGAVPTSYVAVVEALGTGKADFAAFSTFAYVLAKDIKKYEIEAVLKVLRGHGETSYKGQIIAHADSGINKIEDLKGKKFAYVDPTSSAGFIMPAQLFKEKGIQLGDIVFALKHDSVVTMVYNKQVDAGATFWDPPVIKEVDGKKIEEVFDARHLVKTQYPDVEKQVKIIGFTAEIPNAPWVIRSKVLADPQANARLKQAVVDAILEYAQTAEGKEVIFKLQDLTGFQRTSDEEYADCRKAILATDMDLEQVLMKETKKK